MSSGKNNITEHFTFTEMACAHGILYYTPMFHLCCQLEKIRQAIGNKPIIVVSGHRCPECNRLAGGVPLSQHLQSRAADITVEGMTVDELADVILDLINKGVITQGGLGRYYVGKGSRKRPFVHYDTRGKPARWQQWRK
jgi:uncharacterized protein YcbK (DUF882 family)